jgi:hypothetical protein
MFQTPSTTDQPKKSRRLLPLLSGVLIVAVLAGALMFSINARSRAHAASVTKPAPSARLAQTGYVSVTSTILTVSRNSAGDPCKKVTFQENYKVFGGVVAWLKMVTTWCYNYVIVTRHSTVLYWGVTSYGGATGWLWRYSPQYSFNCYVAAGSHRSCSGNHEWELQLFDNVITRSGIDLTVDEWENYRGQAFTHGHSQFCPGGC